MIELRGVSKVYRLGLQELLALQDVDLEISRSEMVALTGSSGSGKSTLMNILGCLDTPSAGDYRLDGRSVGELEEADLSRLRNLKIGFVFQSFYLMPRLTALDNVAQPLIYRGLGPRQRRAEAATALTRVGLQSHLHHRPNELSGGQRQRVAIARALVGSPDLLLADEPTGNLDSETASELMSLLCALHAQGHTIVVITHDPGVAAYCQRIVRLHDGRVIEDKVRCAPRCT
jgi:putative ABC transport system ATP-binding protein